MLNLLDMLDMLEDKKPENNTEMLDNSVCSENILLEIKKYPPKSYKWKKFEGIEEKKIAFCKTKSLLKNKVKYYYNANNYIDVPIIGYLEYPNQSEKYDCLVIEIEGELSCVRTQYLVDMQKSNFEDATV